MEDMFYKELRARLETFQKLSPSYLPKSPMYKTLREYLKPMGLWRYQKRGKAFKPGEDERRSDSRLYGS